VPIPGTRKLMRLEENLGATSVLLTAGELQQIEAGAAPLTATGARLPESALKQTGR